MQPGARNSFIVTTMLSSMVFEACCEALIHWGKKERISQRKPRECDRLEIGCGGIFR